VSKGYGGVLLAGESGHANAVAHTAVQVGIAAIAEHDSSDGASTLNKSKQKVT